MARGAVKTEKELVDSKLHRQKNVTFSDKKKKKCIFYSAWTHSKVTLKSDTKKMFSIHLRILKNVKQ